MQSIQLASVLCWLVFVLITLQHVVADTIPRIDGVSKIDTAKFIAQRGSAFTLKAGNVAIAPESGGWGEWKPWEYCMGNSWAIGYSQRVEQRQGRGDDTALNAVELICGDANGTIMSRILSYGGDWGDWGNPVFCSGAGNFLRGAQFRIEDGQGNRDDTAANDSRFTCTNGLVIQAANGATWGDWKGAAYCPEGSAICGIQSKYEPFRRGRDDTAMNGAMFLCCSTT